MRNIRVNVYEYLQYLLQLERDYCLDNLWILLLSDDVVLLTYLSYQLNNNQKIKQAYRSSIWIQNHHGDWQLPFHILI